LNLLAPGDAIQSSIPGGGYAVFSGTSMAAPHVAGAWAIKKQQIPTASVTDVLNELTTTGVKLTDTRNGLTFPRINLLNVSPPASCTVDVPSDHWRGEYYNNRFLSGSPFMVRDDGNSFLNFDFGVGGPSSACGLGVDNFSMRWTRTVNFESGTYRFTVTGDDGVRLYLDGQLLIDQWYDHAPTSYTAEVTLTGGDHLVVLEYYENAGGAVAQLSWARVYGANCMVGVAPTQWRGEYFNHRYLSGSPFMVRNDGNSFLNFDFGGGGPSVACGLGADNFSIRWTRTVNFAPGTYRFYVTGDDGVRLYVDGQLVIDQWHDQAPTTYTADVPLTAGDHVIILEYYENMGGAVAQLSWSLVYGP